MSDKQPIITIILDRSGSMQSLQETTVSGINKFLKEQPKDALVSLHQFDTHGFGIAIDATFVNVPAKKARLGQNQYAPRGLTPLLDAVGSVVSGIEAKGDHTVVIVTDGYENASKDWDRKRVKALISAKRKKGWQFVFMGAGIDAYGDSQKLGVSADSTYAFAASGISNTAAWNNLSTGTQSYYRGTSSSVQMPNVDTADPTYTPPVTPKP